MGTEVVCGLDVHRSLLVASLRAGGRKGETRKFETNRRALADLDAWLAENCCQVVGMEATGVYWRPVYRTLEEKRKIVVANPQHIRVMKGRKTDRADAAWIAKKLEDEDSFCPSFVPELKVRETREIVRFRENLLKVQTQIRNEVQKMLAGAGIPLKTCMSDMFGASGREILRRMADGQCAWDNLQSLVKGKLTKKVDQMRLALEMPLTEIQRWELDYQLKRHSKVEEELRDVEAKLAKLLVSELPARARLITVPGIAEAGAMILLGFFGSNLSAFPTDGHFASWIGLSPGDNESGGKKFYASRRKGNRFLQGKFTQFALAAVRTRGCWLQGKYRSLCGRMPKPKALGVIAHKLAVIVYHILKDGTEYRDHGGDYTTSAQKARQLRRAIALIKKHGMTVQSKNP
jgi:transposase